MISYEPIIQQLSTSYSQQLDVLRLDLLHQQVSGNKWFKLKYNIEKAIAANHHTVLTFGGAYSNHIAATASACNLFGLKCIGVIRGEEPQELNPTLIKARSEGMQLYFLSREQYSNKTEQELLNYLEGQLGRYYLIEEGGNNVSGILGCMEILRPEWNYDFIFCACGTGTTFGGLVLGKHSEQSVIGISVLKGENKLPQQLIPLLEECGVGQHTEISGNEALESDLLQADCILNTYAFNGYAKYSQELIEFKKEFEKAHAIPLDYLYTNKLFYAVFDLLKQGKIKEKAKILILHSGGIQGNQGFEERYHFRLKR